MVWSGKSKSKYQICELNEAVCDLLLMNVIIDISLEIWRTLIIMIIIADYTISISLYPLTSSTLLQIFLGEVWTVLVYYYISGVVKCSLSLSYQCIQLSGYRKCYKSRPTYSTHIDHLHLFKLMHKYFLEINLLENIHPEKPSYLTEYQVGRTQEEIQNRLIATISIPSSNT